MKPPIIVELIILSVFLVLSSICRVPSVNADLLTAYPVPEEIRSVEPLPTIPENFTGDYLNTTNPQSNIVSPMSATDEIDDREGNHPLYVLVFGDEEERQNWRGFPGDEFPFRSWIDWAKCQIERGDETLVTFGIDIRILGFLEWNSDDSLTTMEDLWYDLESKTSQYLRQTYAGNGWSNYVDAIIGVTAQATPDEPNIPGKSPGPAYLDQGRIFIVVKGQVYWMDDNIVQHEISHLFYADDHYFECCVMAGHKHSQTWIYEDGFLWWVFNDIPCTYTAYSWCAICANLINTNREMYQINPYDSPILIDWWDVYEIEPRAMYLWLDELEVRSWVEYKGIMNPAIRVR